MVFLNRFMATAGIIACASLPVCHQASAQTAGTYSGMQANGANLSVTVGTDPNNGALAITALGVGIIGSCKPGTTTANTGWGLGLNQDLTGSSAKVIYSFDYFYTELTLKFSGNTVSGTVTSYTPIFADVNSGRPKKAVFCTSPKQTFSATLGAPQARTGAPKGVAY